MSRKKYNKVITKTVKYRGKEISVDKLSEKSGKMVTVECKHGQRQARWNRRFNGCKKCLIEDGAFNSCKKGRVITWGDKISKAKKGVKFTEEHKKALIDVRIKKICDKKNIPIEEFDGFPTSGKQFKLRNFLMNSLNKSILRMTVDNQDLLIDEKLSYTVEDLRQHIEDQFYSNPKTGEEMTWDNWSKDGWNIDHVIPDSWFSYSTSSDEDFKKSWCLKNLQPMWAWQNIDKNNRYIGKWVERSFIIIDDTNISDYDMSNFNAVDCSKLTIKNIKTIIANSYYKNKRLLLFKIKDHNLIIDSHSKKYKITVIRSSKDL